MKVTFEEYFPLLVDQCHLKISCMCRVLETKHTYVSQDTFRLIKPDIVIKVTIDKIIFCFYNEALWN